MQSYKRTPETKRLAELSLHQNHAKILATKYGTAIPYLYNSVMLLRRQVIALCVVGVVLLMLATVGGDHLWSTLLCVALCALDILSCTKSLKKRKRFVLLLLKRHRSFLAIDQAAVQFKKAGFVSPETLAEIKWLLTCEGEKT